MNKNPQKGLTLIELAITMSIIAISLTMGVSFIYQFSLDYKREMEFNFFINEVFSAYEQSYMDEVILTRCYNAGPNMSLNNLILSNGLNDVYSESEGWINYPSITLSWKKNGVTNLPQKMVVSIDSVSGFNEKIKDQWVTHSPFFKGLNSNLFVYEKELSNMINIDNYIYIDSLYCESKRI